MGAQESDNRERWKAIEVLAQEWRSTFNGIDAIPLNQLRPIWSAATGEAPSPRANLARIALEHDYQHMKLQNALLKKEIQSLREQLAKTMDLGVSLPNQSAGNQLKAAQ